MMQTVKPKDTMLDDGCVDCHGNKKLFLQKENLDSNGSKARGKL